MSAGRVIVILPAYNEVVAIGSLLARIDSALGQAGRCWSAIVVDDGSTDGTGQVVAEAAERLPVALIRHCVNLGLGATLRDGLARALDEAATNDVIVTLDADGTQPPEMMVSLITLVEAGYDVAIASRFRPGSRVEGVPSMRVMLSTSASLLLRMMFPTPGVRDFTCGYRAYSGETLHRAAAQYRDRFVDQEGFQCMVDLLLKLRRLGASFTEAPLHLDYGVKSGRTKMRVFRTVAATLLLVARRRLGQW